MDTSPSFLICVKCGNDSLTADNFHKNGTRLKKECKECCRKRVAARYKNLKELGLCFDCKNPSQKSVCDVCTERRRQWYHDRYRDRELANGLKRRRSLKLAAFNAYGGPICRCCKETTIEFLSIDHVNDDGAKHRKELGIYSKGTKMYEWLKKNNYPTGFQVLCMNCNFAKGHFGECPHNKQKDTLG